MSSKRLNACLACPNCKKNAKNGLESLKSVEIAYFLLQIKIMKTKNLFAIILTVASLAVLGASQAAAQGALAKKVKGTVEYSEPGSEEFKPLKQGDRIPQGSRVKTGDDGLAYILTMPGVAVRVAANADLTLSKLEVSKDKDKADEALIDLHSGAVHALIKRAKTAKPDFKIKTPQGVAAARGTFYGVYVEDEKAYVAVKEGKVGVKSKRQ